MAYGELGSGLREILFDSSAVALSSTYDELSPDFEPRTNLLAAECFGMPKRSFKRWLSTDLNGYYEKRF